MAINSCSSGLVVTAVIALLLLPAQYYVPDLYSGFEEPLAVKQPVKPGGALEWLSNALVHVPPVDLFLSMLLLSLGLVTYIYEWIQRKIMERRIIKLNQYLGTSLERLRTWDTQQEQLEATLKMVQNATSEYNLLLYLLLRQHRCLAGHNGPPSNCFFDKSMEEDINFLSNPIIDA